MDTRDARDDGLRDPRTLCLECHTRCLEAATYLSTSGHRVEATQIRLLFNCAALCLTSASLLRGGSDVAGRASGACAEVCERCAGLCDQYGDDAAMRACAEACRRCADACRRLAAMAA